MRKLLLPAVAALVLLVGGAEAQAASAVDQAAYNVINAQYQAPTPVAWSAAQEGPSATPVETVAAQPPGGWGGRPQPAGFWSLLRTSALLGFAGLTIGLSAAGVRSLWIADRTEYSPGDFLDYR